MISQNVILVVGDVVVVVAAAVVDLAIHGGRELDYSLLMCTTSDSYYYDVLCLFHLLFVVRTTLRISKPFASNVDLGSVVPSPMSVIIVSSTPTAFTDSSVKLISFASEDRSKYTFQTSVNRRARFHSKVARPSLVQLKEPSAKTLSPFANDA
mmetsp:Transcript_3229/g.3945  ORF Transcript_3229/g.3945 Transcript_3229/m.3945 type:complete len:153 (-) Transcript_3229:737-1195(-)